MTNTAMRPDAISAPLVFPSSPTEQTKLANGKELTCIFDEMLRHSQVRNSPAVRETRSVKNARKTGLVGQVVALTKPIHTDHDNVTLNAKNSISGWHSRPNPNRPLLSHGLD